jgi:ATP-binding cassette subfamily B protein
VDRINEVMDAKIDIEDHPESTCQVTQGEVSFQDVSFRYPGQSGDSVLQHITFTAKPGTKTAILGATGSGKTSLVNLIPRLYDVESGRVAIDGQDVRNFSLKALRSAIGVALQESVLFTGTIAENLRWGNPEATDEDLAQMTHVAQADEFISKTEKGYDTELGQRGVNLSGGQKQRMSIARALIKRPKILILDDSTSAVDLTTEAAIQDGLREALKDCTVFLIAQRISAALDADQIIVLDDGKIADIGTHDELKVRCEIYRQIVISQLGKEAA